MSRPNQNSKWKAGQQPEPTIVDSVAKSNKTTSTSVKTTQAIPEPVIPEKTEDPQIETVDVTSLKKIKKTAE